ncbi:MAG: zinc ribbon domain-containing protein [Candidatus Burarchaeum sp.]|nr:zinc ribbon domain-containing protein [Candidatus Burarchaeum sp.]MDO8339566.1 zinc ribbon domain-containing protein [Candidatus Burarchaeum sp.]
MTMTICESCGMPMEGDATHGGHRQDNKYCAYCTTPDGKLKSKAQVREGMIKYMMKSEKKSEDEARQMVDDHMSRMPAWKGK